MKTHSEHLVCYLGSIIKPIFGISSKDHIKTKPNSSNNKFGALFVAHVTLRWRRIGKMKWSEPGMLKYESTQCFSPVVYREVTNAGCVSFAVSRYLNDLATAKLI